MDHETTQLLLPHKGLWGVLERQYVFTFSGIIIYQYMLQEFVIPWIDKLINNKAAMTGEFIFRWIDGIQSYI